MRGIGPMESSIQSRPPQSGTRRLLPISTASKHGISCDGLTLGCRAMRAATISDGSVVVADHPDPEPAKNEILVRVRAAGLNGADIMQRAGRYPAPPGDPQDIPGLEMAGEVVALGPGAQRFSEGDRVMAVVGGGGQAELCVVHERGAMPVPDAFDWPQAGGFP